MPIALEVVQPLLYEYHVLYLPINSMRNEKGTECFNSKNYFLIIKIKIKIQKFFASVLPWT